MSVISLSQYTCATCLQHFSTSDLLTRHVFSHWLTINAPLYICLQCGEVFLNISSLCTHSFQHSKETKATEPSFFEFTCAFCAQTFLSWNCLVKHVFNHIPVCSTPLNVCTHCHKVFEDKAKFHLHKHASKTSQIRSQVELQKRLVTSCQQNDFSGMEVPSYNHTVASSLLVGSDVGSNVNIVSLSRSLQYKCAMCLQYISTRELLIRHVFSYNICINMPLHICHICGHIFLTKSMLSAHNFQHNKKIKFNGSSLFQLACAFCAQTFLSWFHVTTHVFSHILTISAPLYVCTYCCEVFDDMAKLYLHKKTRTLQRRCYFECQCNTCNSKEQPSAAKSIQKNKEKRAVTSNNYSEKLQKINLSDTLSSTDVCGKYCLKPGRHKGLQSTQSVVHPIPCEVCGKYFKHSRYLKKHQKIHLSERPFSCDLCGKCFICSWRLKTHQRSHSIERPFPCTVCSKSFKYSASLKEHQRIHSGERPFSCYICGKSFTQSGNLQAHLRIHSGERPFSCKECGKSFSDPSSLKNHAVTHSSIKLFSCEFCGKCFKLSSSLRSHRRIHIDAKPFSCNLCKKTFSRSRYLKVHQIIHLSERPFPCNICGKSFIWSSNLNVHQKIHLG